MVASCMLKAQRAPSSQGKTAYFLVEGEEEIHSPALLLCIRVPVCTHMGVFFFFLPTHVFLCLCTCVYEWVRMNACVI